MHNVRKRYVTEGIEVAVYGTPPLYHSEQKVSGEALEKLLDLAASPPPDERTACSYQLLADRLAELRIVASVNQETVRKALIRAKAARQEG